MNRSVSSAPRIALTIVAGTLLSSGRLNSQYPAPVALQKTPEASLTEIKAANDATLSKQQAALLRLDAMQKEADQVRAYAARS